MGARGVGDGGPLAERTPAYSSPLLFPQPSRTAGAQEQRRQEALARDMQAMPFHPRIDARSDRIARSLVRTSPRAHPPTLSFPPLRVCTSRAPDSELGSYQALVAGVGSCRWELARSNSQLNKREEILPLPLPLPASAHCILAWLTSLPVPPTVFSACQLACVSCVLLCTLRAARTAPHPAASRGCARPPPSRVAACRGWCLRCSAWALALATCQRTTPSANARSARRRGSAACAPGYGSQPRGLSRTQRLHGRRTGGEGEVGAMSPGQLRMAARLGQKPIK